MSINDNSNDDPVLFPLEGDNTKSAPPDPHSSKSRNPVAFPTSTKKGFKWRHLFYFFILLIVLYFLYNRYVSQSTDETQTNEKSEKSEIETFSRYSLNANTYMLNVRNEPLINSNVVSILTKDDVFYGRQSTNEGWTEIYDEEGSMVGFAKTKHLTLVY